MKIIILNLLLLVALSTAAQSPIADFVELPNGFKRVKQKDYSFGAYLQTHLKLKAGQVLYSDGSLKRGQTNHVALIDVPEHLQKNSNFQCADFVMYQWASYLRYLKVNSEYSNVKLPITPISFTSWDGKSFAYSVYTEKNLAKNRKKYANESPARRDLLIFTDYMNQVYERCNTASMMADITSVPLDSMRVGDVFIKPVKGDEFGHVVLIVDMARNVKGETIFLLGQGLLPAQTPHVITNPSGKLSKVWYTLSEIRTGLQTPHFRYDLPASQFYRFKELSNLAGR